MTEFNSITLEELKMLRDFLEPLKNASDELEASKYPTLHLVHPWFHAILQHFQPNLLDPAMVSHMKVVGLAYWTKNVQTYITSFHDVAVGLHPEMKDLRLYTEQEQKAVWKKVGELMDIFSPRIENRNDFRIETDPPPKKRVLSKAMHFFISDRRDNDTAELNELDEYKSLRLRNDFDSLLDWWEDNKTRFPRLYCVARFIHSIPASSAAAERLFSKAGRIVTFRPNMKAGLVDELLFLKSNIDMFNKLKTTLSEEESSAIMKEVEHAVENDSEPGSDAIETCEDEFFIYESDTDVEN